MINCLLGVLYEVVFASPTAPRVTMLVCSCIAALTGLSTVLGAKLIASWRVGPILMSTNSLVQFGAGVIIVVLDGGLGSPLAAGLLIPLPLTTLTATIKGALPVCIGVGGAYAAIGLLVGAPSGWYIAVNLIATSVLCAACASRGYTAGQQRKLLTLMTRADSLTGCVNRRGFEERFNAQLAETRRQNSTLSLLVLDLDDFKQVNDTQGHAAGDELLCWVGETLKTLLRAHDVVGRLGGDEFVALLSNCSTRPAGDIADRVRVVLGQRTGASIGTATLDLDGDDFGSLYRHADAELYAEKARHIRFGNDVRSHCGDALKSASPTPTT